MHLIRKNTRFRIYLWTLSFAYVGVLVFLLSRQSRFYESRLDSMQKDFSRRLDEVVARVPTVSTPVAGDSVQVVSCLNSDVPGASPEMASLPLPSYYVLGHARSGKWGYIDIMFSDGERARYYYRPQRRRDLDSLVYRLELDAHLHKFGLIGRTSSSDVFPES